MDKEKMENWVSINLPEGCPNICISFDRETAEKQIEKFGAKPIYGFEGKKEAWLPTEIFITYGGHLAPERGLDKLFRHYKVDPQEEIYGIGTMTKDCLDVAMSEFVGDIAKRQRTIIDYDEDCDTILLRFLPMDYGGKDPGVKSKAKETGKVERTLKTLDKGRAFKKEELDRLKKQLEANRARIPENELKTKYKLAYEKILKEIAKLEEAIGGESSPNGKALFLGN